LDGLRGLAALSILVLHVWMYTQANDPDHDVLVDRVIGEFRTGVLLFFVLSAFLLAAPWVAASRGERPAPHLGRFALRRASRIVPGYLLALAGSPAACSTRRCGRCTSRSPSTSSCRSSAGRSCGAR